MVPIANLFTLCIRIPQVLSSMGLIQYDSFLQAKLFREEIVTLEEEAEIRAAAIIACEKLKQELNCCNAVELDFYLWVPKTI